MIPEPAERAVLWSEIARAYAQMLHLEMKGLLPTVALTSPLRAQSLGDVAAAEAACRGTAAPSAKVFTNADLPNIAEAVNEPAQSPVAGSQPVSGDRKVANIVTLIRTKCAKDWPDDFKMGNYCEEQQLKALDVLGR